MKNRFNNWCRTVQNWTRRRFYRICRRLLDMQRDISIRKKLPALLAVQIVIPLVLVSFVGYMIAKRSIEDKSIAGASNLLRSIQYNIEGYTDKFTQVTQDIFYEDDFYSALRTPAQSDPLVYYETYNEITRILKRITLSRSDLETIYVVTNEKQYYITNNGKQEGAGALPYEALVSRAREKKGKPVWLIETGQRDNSVFFARTIYDKDSFQELGLLAFKMRTEYFSELCQGMLNDDIYSISVIDQNGAEIIHAGGVRFSLTGTLLERIPGASGTVIDNQQEALINYISFFEPDWTVISYTPLDVLYRESNRIRSWMVWLSIISVSLLSLLSVLVSYDFLIPIKQLMKAMEAVDEEGGMKQLKEDRKDEFGVLIQNFNRMTERIRKLIKWGYKEELMRREAQIKALQAQINPHFLFNTLDSINWMAQMNGVKEISQMVTSLAYIMNASMGRENKLITLREELNYIEHYMRILKFRFGEKVNLRVDFSGEILDFRMPRLLIQPLVENSIHHGIEKRKELKRGFVYLKGYFDQGTAVIEVIDNGIGLPEARVEALNRRFETLQVVEPPARDQQERKSLGLENVCSRVKLYYGDEYGITVKSRQGYYTRVILKAPADGIKEQTDGEESHV